MGSYGDAQAGPNGEIVSIDIEGRADCRDDTARENHRIFWPAGVSLNDGEFIPAEPGHSVGLPDAAEQAPGNRAQQPITHWMPKSVIHRLEPVEVEAEHGKAYPTAELG